MFSEELFDGWLSVPSLGNMFEPDMSMSRAQQHSGSSPQDSTQQTSLTLPERGADAQSLPALATTNTPTDIVTARKRRGHTKSRLGCTSCKQRKVKCPEQWPSCSNCVKRGNVCRYPKVFKHTQHERIFSEVMKTQGPRRAVHLSDTPLLYSANDMRLFHHFIIAAHPCIPDEFERLWVSDIPAMSYKYDYLMHALLALSSSHLSLMVNDPQYDIALSYRQKAITGLEDAFTRWPPSAEEAHIMLAGSFLLAFQSGYMPDAFIDHIINLRGCHLLSQLILDASLKGCFSIDPLMQSAGLDIRLANFPGLNQRLALTALQSMSLLVPLLTEEHTIERAVFAQLVGCVRPLLTGTLSLSSAFLDTPNSPGSERSTTDSEVVKSPFTIPSPLPYINNPLLRANVAVSYDELLTEGVESITAVPTSPREALARHSFDALMSSLLILATWPQDQVFRLLSPTNKVGCAVMAHFMAVRFIVSPLSAPPTVMSHPIQAMVEWCEKQMDELENDGGPEWAEYIKWPIKVFSTLRHSINRKNGMTFGDAHAIITKDPEAFIDGRAAVV